MLERPLRVGTINVRGLCSKRRQCQLSRLFADKNLDIVAVQESKIESEDRTESMVQVFGSQYNVCVSHAVGMSGGCLVFLKKCIGKVEQVISCESGRMVLCDFSYCSFTFRVVCIYAPNRVEERRFFC